MLKFYCDSKHLIYCSISYSSFSPQFCYIFFQRTTNICLDEHDKVHFIPMLVHFFPNFCVFLPNILVWLWETQHSILSLISFRRFSNYIMHVIHKLVYITKVYLYAVAIFGNLGD